jgi:hypothetical protein
LEGLFAVTAWPLQWEHRQNLSQSLVHLASHLPHQDKDAHDSSRQPEEVKKLRVVSLFLQHMQILSSHCTGADQEIQQRWYSL